MAILELELNDETLSEFNTLCAQLGCSVQGGIQTAIDYFLQAPGIASAIEGLSRKQDGQSLVNLPALKEEVGFDIQFHPKAMEELGCLSEEIQADILDALVMNLTDEEGVDQEIVELILREEHDRQVVLAQFDFADVVYEIGQNVIVYHICAPPEEEIEDYQELEENL